MTPVGRAFKFYLCLSSFNYTFQNVLLRSVVICFQILSLTTFLQVYNQAKSTLNVVICFQILSLTTFLQVTLIQCCIVLSCDLLSNFIFDNVLTRKRKTQQSKRSCDLLSNFIFDNVLTRMNSKVLVPSLLWFAFKFYLWQRSYKCEKWVQCRWQVVICFQILSLTTFLQVACCNQSV